MTQVARSSPQSACNHFRELIVAMFSEFDSRKIPFLVLRNYETLPDLTSNDVDVLVRPGDGDAAMEAVRVSADATGWAVSHTGRYSCFSVFLFRPDTFEQTHVDLMLGNRWHSMVFADHAAMLDARRPVRGFYAPAKADEAWIDFATRMLYHGYVKRKYRPRIQSICTEDRDAAEAVFSRFLGKKLAGTVVGLCSAGDWGKAESLRWRVRFRVFLKNAANPIGFAARIGTDAVRFLDRFFNPVGLCVGLSGRSQEWRDSVAEILMHDFAGTFSPKKTFRFGNANRDGEPLSTPWNNVFHGGLSILDLPDDKSGSGRCDMVFSEKPDQDPRILCPPAAPELRPFVLSAVFGFLKKRTESRHA